jgi:hypothetical protein
MVEVATAGTAGTAGDAFLEEVVEEVVDDEVLLVNIGLSPCCLTITNDLFSWRYARRFSN